MPPPILAVCLLIVGLVLIYCGGYLGRFRHQYGRGNAVLMLGIVVTAYGWHRFFAWLLWLGA